MQWVQWVAIVPAGESCCSYAYLLAESLIAGGCINVFSMASSERRMSIVCMLTVPSELRLRELDGDTFSNHGGSLSMHAERCLMGSHPFPQKNGL